MTLGIPAAPDWLLAIRRYLAASAVLHLVWEVVQLPLYTIWSEPIPKQAFAVLHCTAGDLMIAGLALLAALALAGRAEWPRSRATTVWLLLLTIGAGYTIYSEWLNVYMRGNWAYAAAMPVLPFIGTGLSPLLQWIIVPTAAFYYAAGFAPWKAEGTST